MDTPPKPPESLSGLIDRVTFFNEENGFAILKLNVKGHRQEVTVVGSLPAVNPGEWLTAEGHWVQDREFGRQFRATLLNSTAPTTREGIEKYLGSGMVRGIGPVYAKKLVAKFGEKIFDIIESTSARLEEVEGIGPERRRRIKVAWAEQKLIREIMVFLHSNGVSTSRAVRIYKTYGERAIEEVRANPYCLSRDIMGIGFKTADQVAQKMGIPHDSVLRAVAGLRHVLLEATNAGHCALPVDLLLDQATQLLQVNRAIVETALQRTLGEQELAREQVEGEALIYLPWLRVAEERVAARTKALCSGPSNYPAIDFAKALQWYQQKTGKTLAPSQTEALKHALCTRMLIVTGGPGVGKTTLVHAILKILHAKKVRFQLCAPTGRAARRLNEATGFEAKTIHRLLEVQRGKGFKRNEDNPLVCDLLVVDETSMVDLPLMHHLLRALPVHASLLLVGDVDQLPSVGPGMVLRDLIDSGLPRVVRLTEIFRQADNSRIVTSAHKIREGLLPELSADGKASDFYFVHRDEPERIVETLLNLLKQRIPDKFQFDPVLDVQVLAPMNRGSLGVHELNVRLQNELNPLRSEEPSVEKFGSQFRLRDKVIQTENDYDKDVFNGDIGQVTKIDPIEKQLTVRFDQREVSYEFGELDELALAYAITIHKSQGSEFPAVVLPIATQQYALLQRNLLYTAVTRGKRLVVIVGQEKALSIAVRNNRTERRFSGLLARLRSDVPVESAAAAP